MVNGTGQIKSNLWIYIGIIPLCDTLKVKGMIFIIKRGACESDRQYCAELHLSVVFSLENNSCNMQCVPYEETVLTCHVDFIF